MNHLSSASFRRLAVATATAVGTLALCTACTGGSTPANAAGTQTGTPAATSSASGTATAPGGAVQTAPSAVASPANAPTTSGGGGGGNGGGSGVGSGSGSHLTTCLPRYLNASAGASQGTAGSIYVDIVFKNLNNQACTLYGYPGVSFGAGTPVTQVGQPADRNPFAPPTLVTLQPGGYAYAILQVGDAGNWPPPTCHPTPTTYLQVIAPNTSNTLYVAYKSTACAGNVVTMHVEVVQPGTGPQ